MSRARRLAARAMAALVLLVGLVLAPPVRAAAVDLVADGCAVVGERGTPPAPGAGCDATREEGEAASGWLWLTASVATGSLDRPAVTIRMSRMAGATVLFRYADGAEVRRAIRSGNYGDAWRIGGRVVIEAPERASPLAWVAVGIEKPALRSLLRVQLGNVPAPQAQAAVALAVGAGLALLLLAAAGNLFFGLAIRRTALIWNAAWAGSVFGWALMWSQTALFVVPGLAGTRSAELLTMFATLAIACAGGFLLASVERHSLSRRLRLALATVAAAVPLTGLAVNLAPPTLMGAAAALLNAAVAATTLGGLAAAALAWRRGSGAARDFLLSFTVPTLAVLWTVVSGHGASKADQGGLFLVLVACALQTVWLSLVSAARLWRLRLERDAARAAEARMATLALTDPLTGLLNRRGFTARVEPVLAQAGGALVLIDLDRFKTVNDTHGHETGDRLLLAVARALAAAAGDQPVARLGGEEFALFVADPAAAALTAQRLRGAIARATVWVNGAPLAVTGSIGVATSVAGAAFVNVYRAADRALYAAKSAGRDRVEIAAGSVPPLALAG